MATDDFVDLVMSMARQQMNTFEYREDEIIHILKVVSETLTLVESDPISITLNDHPVKYDDTIAIYDRCTYGA